MWYVPLLLLHSASVPVPEPQDSLFVVVEEYPVEPSIVLVPVVEYVFDEDLCACLGFFSIVLLTILCCRCQEKTPVVQHGTIVTPCEVEKIDKVDA